MIFQSLYYQYILDKFHFFKSPKTFRVIITITTQNYCIIIMLSVNFFCNISSYDILALCENSTSTMPVSRGEGWVFSCLSSYI